MVLQPAPVHDAAPSTVWPGHAVQVAAPVAELCWPGAQSVQVAAPVAALCLPAAQAVHGGLPLGPKKPALHVQAAEVVDPGGLLEPEGQAVHVAFPAPLNCPAGHASHLDLSAERTCPAPALPQQSPVVLQPAPVHDDAPATVWPGHLRRKRRRPERENKERKGAVSS